MLNVSLQLRLYSCNINDAYSIKNVMYIFSPFPQHEELVGELSLSLTNNLINMSLCGSVKLIKVLKLKISEVEKGTEETDMVTWTHTFFFLLI